MADPSASDNPDEQPGSPPPRASRAARRKVDLPGARPDPDAPADEADTGAEATPPPRRVVKKPPLYRRGGFWFWVIVAEVLVALVLSYRFEPSLDTIDPAGADVPAFCAAVTGYREAAAAAQTVSVESSPAEFEREAEAYRTLRALGPTELQPDLDKLIKSATISAETAREVNARKVVDNTYLGGIDELNRVRNEQDARIGTADERLTLAVRQLCGVDLATQPLPPAGSSGSSGSAVVPTTGAGPTTSVPDPVGTTPATSAPGPG